MDGAPVAGLLALAPLISMMRLALSTELLNQEDAYGEKVGCESADRPPIGALPVSSPMCSLEV